MKKKIAIIGGGASGLFVSSMMNKSGAEIFLFEKSNRLGKKILASGNGKCNFTNIGDYNQKYNTHFANNVINKFNVEDTLNQFSKMGLIYKSDDQGRCYPVSECANSVLDCLKNNIKNVNILLESSVDSILVVDDKICVVYNNKNRMYFDYVVCCSGNCASNLGSEKSYSYLRNLDVKINESRGSLAPVIVKEKTKSLSGVRVKCIVNLIDKTGTNIYSENGEVIFKDNGLSGIAVFNATSIINRKKSEYKISLDISNNIPTDELKKYFKFKSKDNLFKGFLNDKIGEYITNKLELNYCSINEQKISEIIGEIKNMEFNVVSVYPLKDSQVVSGGVAIEEVSENLNLKKYDNIYLAGELLDVDGMCGGYNLQFAWSSAGVIAKDIKRRMDIIDEK